jgi:spore coat protein U-like protein
MLAVIMAFALACAQQGSAQSCTLTISTLNFGTYTGSLLNGTATAKVTCSGGWDIPMDAGTGAGATETNRKMTGPFGATLNYSLFRDSARTENWGNTTATEMTGTGNANITVYGQLAASQFVVSGVYTDTIHTATTSFTVTATIVANCTITASALNFGVYAGTAVNATSTIVATCTKNAPYYVGLDAGNASGATVTTRRMTSGSNTLKYALYLNSSRTTNWGNTVGSDTATGTGTGANQSLTVYGQMPGGQALIPGSYADTITATITY